MEATIMENQMEKKMENKMETREYIGIIPYSHNCTVGSPPQVDPALSP